MSMRIHFTYFLGILLCWVSACHPLPKQRYQQSPVSVKYEVVAGKVEIEISNPLHCHLRIKASSEDPEVSGMVQSGFPLVMSPMQDTILRFPTDRTEKDFKISFTSTFGRVVPEPPSVELTVPFPKGKSYRVVQGYGGKLSHNADYSRYALDLDLQEGDTIIAALPGYVVGVIEDYQYGGKDRKWRDYANFITLYHPEPNLFTQYVHLTYQGSLVEVGDTVERAQAIGLAGSTGFTTTPHLHFNVLKPTEESMVSTPVIFQGGIDGKQFKEGIRINRGTTEEKTDP